MECLPNLLWQRYRKISKQTKKLFLFFLNLCSSQSTWSNLPTRLCLNCFIHFSCSWIQGPIYNVEKQIGQREDDTGVWVDDVAVAHYKADVVPKWSLPPEPCALCRCLYWWVHGHHCLFYAGGSRQLRKRW